MSARRALQYRTAYATAATRVAEGELRYWRKAAAREGKTLSRWIRELANKAAHGELADTREVEQLLRLLSQADVDLTTLRRRGT